MILSRVLAFGHRTLLDKELAVTIENKKIYHIAIIVMIFCSIIVILIPVNEDRGIKGVFLKNDNLLSSHETKKNKGIGDIGIIKKSWQQYQGFLILEELSIELHLEVIGFLCNLCAIGNMLLARQQTNQFGRHLIRVGMMRNVIKNIHERRPFIVVIIMR